MPGGLVEVGVDADHEPDAVERLVEPIPVGRGQHGVTGDGDHRLDLSLAGRVDLLGQCGGGHFGQRLGIARHSAVPAAGLEAAAGFRRPGCRHRGPEREHRAAGSVEVTGQDVDDIDQPAGERAEFDCGRTDSAVHRRRRRCGELAGQRPDVVGGHTAVVTDILRREPGRQAADVVEAVDVLGDAAEFRCDKAFFEKHVHDGEQESTVGAWPRSDVPVGHFGGAGAGRIDHGEPAAALPQCPQLAGEVGCGGQTAVGDKGIRADDHQVVGAVEVGHRECDRAAEHMAQRNVFGHLVQGAGGERLTGAEPADDQRRVQAACDGVRVGVAKVHADGRPAVLADDLAQPVRDDGEGLIPRRLGQHAVTPHHRP